jgi:hypothetical protein
LLNTLPKPFFLPIPYSNNSSFLTIPYWPFPI